MAQKPLRTIRPFYLEHLHRESYLKTMKREKERIEREVREQQEEQEILEILQNIPHRNGKSSAMKRQVNLGFQD